MITKLTLTVEKDVIEQVKIYAKKSGKSLSEMVQNYFLQVLNKENDESDISVEVKKIAGKIKLPQDFNDNDEKRNYLEKKYL